MASRIPPALLSLSSRWLSGALAMHRRTGLLKESSKAIERSRAVDRNREKRCPFSLDLPSFSRLLRVLCKLRNVKIVRMYHDSSDWRCDPRREMFVQSGRLSVATEPELHQTCIDWAHVSCYSSLNSWHADQHWSSNKHLDGERDVSIRVDQWSTWGEKLIVDFMDSSEDIFWRCMEA